MTVIQFRPKKKQEAAPVAENNGPKPNFEDPHSRDFFEEPRYNKAQERIILDQSEVEALNRLKTKLCLFAAFHKDRIELSQTIDAEENGVTVLGGAKNLVVPVADIFKASAETTDLKYSYTLAQTQESQGSNSLLSLLIRLENHLETGSPELPEPNVWR